ncbi:MAG: linX, partial [Phenylobacterium sp.]|nr:linX [Phenylobacterium sp.]
MAGRLQGKVAVITGGVSGIGLGTVELFAAEGCQIIAADIQDEKGRMLEQRFPGQVRYAHCDVTSEAEIAAALNLAKAEFGGLDILFNNAGISDGMRVIAEIEADTWSWIFDVLVRGPALGMKYAAPLMLERGGGSIINTASIAGLQAGWGPIAYSSAKAAVIHMSRCAA